jgi:hypothetical protein
MPLTGCSFLWSSWLRPGGGKISPLKYIVGPNWTTGSVAPQEITF